MTLTIQPNNPTGDYFVPHIVKYFQLVLVNLQAYTHTYVCMYYILIISSEVVYLNLYIFCLFLPAHE